MRSKNNTCRFCQHRTLIENDSGKNSEAPRVGWCVELEQYTPRKQTACEDFSRRSESQRSHR